MRDFQRWIERRQKDPTLRPDNMISPSALCLVLGMFVLAGMVVQNAFERYVGSEPVDLSAELFFGTLFFVSVALLVYSRILAMTDEANATSRAFRQGQHAAEIKARAALKIELRQSEESFDDWGIFTLVSLPNARKTREGTTSYGMWLKELGHRNPRLIEVTPGSPLHDLLRFRHSNLLIVTLGKGDGEHAVQSVYAVDVALHEGEAIQVEFEPSCWRTLRSAS